MDYSFIQKNHWRNMIWNRLSKYVSVHPRDALVIYLPAESDFDREVALRKGFRSENLIAVDRDPSVCEKIRSSGGLAICGDLFHVLAQWSNRHTPHAILADLTCGLEPSILVPLGELILARKLQKTVFLVNLLRGRDPRLSEHRIELEQVLKSALGAFPSRFGFKPSEKHRGLMLYVTLLRTIVSRYAEYDADEIVNVGPERFAQFVSSRMGADIGSYRSSSGQYFDWIIFKNDCWFGCREWNVVPQPDDELKASISAVLAHRTRRLEAAS